MWHASVLLPLQLPLVHLLLHCIICATAKLHILIALQRAAHLVTFADLAAALAMAFLWRF